MLRVASFADATISVMSTGSLSSKFITCIAKDRQGLMWASTKEGLYAYDGYDFTGLRLDSLNDVIILDMKYDNIHDLLWIATDRGIYQLSCFKRKPKRVGDLPWQRNRVTGIVVAAGVAYASFSSGEIVSADDNGTALLVTRISDAPIVLKAISENSILAIQEGRNLLRLQIRKKSPPTIIERCEMPNMISVAGDTLVTDNDRGVHIFAGIQHTDITPAVIKIRGVSHLSGVNWGCDHSVWLLQKPLILFHVNLSGGSISTISDDVMAGRSANCMFTDEQGIIWIGTDKGLLRVTVQNPFFHHALVQDPSISVRPIAKDEYGNLYTGTFQGIFKVEKGHLNWKKIVKGVQYGLLNTPGKYLYHVGDNQGLYRLNKSSGDDETDFYHAGPGSDSILQHIYSLALDNDSILWMGGAHGLAAYDIRKNEVRPYNNIVDNKAAIEIRHIRPAAKHQLWLSTNHGLSLFNRDRGVVWHIDQKTMPALSQNTVNYMDIDRYGRLWLCTAGGGINIVSADRRSITVLKKDDGLSDNTTYNLLWDNKGKAWISTYNGLSMYDTAARTFTNFYVLQGLTNNEFNHNSFYKDTDGAMYFGGIKGMNKFYPDSLRDEHSKCRLFASAITKWDSKTHSFAQIIAAHAEEEIILAPLDHSLAFSFALTDYTDAENNRYYYRVIGLAQEWTSLNNEHILRLNGLAAGNYTLEVKAISGRGIAAQNIIRFQIKVLQSFYKSVWFYLCLLLLISGLLWIIFRARLKQVRKLHSLREQISSDLHDEVGSILTGIAMTSDSLLYTSQTKNELNTGLQKIAGLSRSAVSSMSDVLWSIDSSNDFTGNLADRMREQAENMINPIGASIVFDINMDPEMALESGFRQQLYFIYKEVVNNIAKHSKATVVSIKYHHRKEGFELRVENNGVTSVDDPSKGRGLKNIAMRAQKLNATAKISATGDTFCVHIAGNFYIVM